VGQSTGTEATKRVITSEGWLGTTLAEVTAHADTIVTVGEGLLIDAPLLRSRFIEPAIAQRQANWIHVTDRLASPASAAIESSKVRPNIVSLERTRWYEAFTEVLCRLRGDSFQPAVFSELQLLLAGIEESTHCVFMWDVDEFYESLDELLIRRMLGIARYRSRSARCSLLCVDSNIGRVTAEETLLWLTGCNTSATYDGNRWCHNHRYQGYSMFEWEQEFDAIVFIRTCPSTRPLPDLGFRWKIMDESHGDRKAVGDAVTYIAEIGTWSPGHLMRGDRAVMLLCDSGEPDVVCARPTAEAVLKALYHELTATGGLDAT
jgi:hypothetical protein